MAKCSFTGTVPATARVGTGVEEIGAFVGTPGAVVDGTLVTGAVVTGAPVMGAVVTGAVVTGALVTGAN